MQHTVVRIRIPFIDGKPPVRSPYIPCNRCCSFIIQKCHHKCLSVIPKPDFQLCTFAFHRLIFLRLAFYTGNVLCVCITFRRFLCFNIAFRPLCFCHVNAAGIGVPCAFCISIVLTTPRHKQGSKYHGCHHSHSLIYHTCSVIFIFHIIFILSSFFLSPFKLFMFPPSAHPCPFRSCLITARRIQRTKM